MEYTRARKAMPFFPDSEIHTVDVAPVQESFTGMHARENELFRMESQVAGEIQAGNRVVSGLAVDDSGRQHQAHGPPASHEPVAGVAPLCEEYSNPAMSPQDWENPKSWRNVLELGIIRVTPAVIEPLSKPSVLLLNGHECNVARVTAFIRLGKQSAGGIVYRAKSLTDYFAAVLNTERRVASLEVCRAGTISTLSESPVFYLNPSIRHKISIIDHGESGLMEMQLDNRVVLTYEVPSTERGRFGLTISRGIALFDGFAVER